MSYTYVLDYQCDAVDWQAEWDDPKSWDDDWRADGLDVRTVGVTADPSTDDVVRRKIHLAASTREKLGDLITRWYVGSISEATCAEDVELVNRQVASIATVN